MCSAEINRIADSVDDVDTMGYINTKLKLQLVNREPFAKAFGRTSVASLDFVQHDIYKEVHS